MAVFNGTNLLLKTVATGGSATTIGHSTSASMSLSLDTPRHNKDSSGFSEYIAGVRGARFLLRTC